VAGYFECAHWLLTYVSRLHLFRHCSDGHLRHDCLAAGPMGERACFLADCGQEPLENSFL
jgi:hypothetical protein